MRRIVHRRVWCRIVVGPRSVVGPRAICVLRLHVLIAYMIKSNPASVSIICRVSFLIIPVGWRYGVLRFIGFTLWTLVRRVLLSRIGCGAGRRPPVFLTADRPRHILLPHPIPSTMMTPSTGATRTVVSAILIATMLRCGPRTATRYTLTIMYCQ